MSYIAVGTGALSLITGGIKALGGNKAKKRAAAEAANIKPVSLDNVAAGLKVSTLGAKNRQEGQSVLETTQMSALQDAGTRAIGVGTGRVAAGSQAVSKDIAVNLDEQQNNIEMMKAEDEGRIRGVKEQRNASKLAALSSQYNAAADAEQQGYGNMIQGVGMAGSAAAGSGKLGGSKSSGSGKSFSSKYSVASTRPK